MEKIVANPFEIPAGVIVTCTLSIPRKDVSRLSKGLYLFTKKRKGHVYSWVDLEKGFNLLRFEWYKPFRGKRYGLKINVFFTIKQENLEKIEARISYGETWGAKTKEESIDFSLKQKRGFQKYIKSVLNEAFELPRAKNKFYLNYYISVPAMKAVGKKVIKSRGLKVTILPSRIVTSGLQRVSPVILTIEEPCLELARSAGDVNIGRFNALATIAMGELFEIAKFDGWPKNKKRVSSISSLDETESTNFFNLKTSDCPQTEINKKFDKQLGHILSIYSRLEEKEKKKINGILFAFYSGLQASAKHPTLAITAFVAALGAMVKPTKCKGKLSCSEGCSLGFKHSLEGEKKVILGLILKNLNAPKGGEAYQYVVDTFNRIYDCRRSAFVHDAVFKHDENIQKRYPSFMPTSDKLVSGEYLYSNDIMFLRGVTRTAILVYMAKSASVKLNKKLLNLRQGITMPLIAIEATVGKTPVTFVLNNDKPSKSPKKTCKNL